MTLNWPVINTAISAFGLLIVIIVLVIKYFWSIHSRLLRLELEANATKEQIQELKQKDFEEKYHTETAVTKVHER